MHRRALLKAGALVAAGLATGAHTPYRQWTVYRRKHLLLLAHRGDPPTYRLAKRLADRLLHHLPDSRARVTRAPHLHRVASLLATDQLQFAVLAPADALTMVRGDAPLEAYGEVPLAALASAGGRLLVARADVPARHAWLIAEALDGAEAVQIGGAHGELPPHPGAAAYARGDPLPD